MLNIRHCQKRISSICHLALNPSQSLLRRFAFARCHRYASSRQLGRHGTPSLLAHIGRRKLTRPRLRRLWLNKEPVFLQTLLNVPRRYCRAVGIKIGHRHALAIEPFLQSGAWHKILATISLRSTILYDKRLHSGVKDVDSLESETRVPSLYDVPTRSILNVLGISNIRQFKENRPTIRIKSLPDLPRQPQRFRPLIRFLPAPIPKESFGPPRSTRILIQLFMPYPLHLKHHGKIIGHQRFIRVSQLHRPHIFVGFEWLCHQLPQIMQRRLYPQTSISLNLCLPRRNQFPWHHYTCINCTLPRILRLEPPHLSPRLLQSQARRLKRMLRQKMRAMVFPVFAVRIRTVRIMVILVAIRPAMRAMVTRPSRTTPTRTVATGASSRTHISRPQTW